MLSKTGAVVSLANDGFEGVEKGKNHRFDVILMDIQMPGMDGYEAVKQLREMGYSGPIVALTAHAMLEERQRTERSGFTHFLSKPIDSELLLHLLYDLKAKRFIEVSCWRVRFWSAK